MYVNDLLSIIRMSYKDSCYLSFYLLHSRCDMLTWSLYEYMDMDMFKKTSGNRQNRNFL